MVDRRAKFPTGDLRAASGRIESARAASVTTLVHFCHTEEG